MFGDDVPHNVQPMKYPSISISLLLLRTGNRVEHVCSQSRFWKEQGSNDGREGRLNGLNTVSILILSHFTLAGG